MKTQIAPRPRAALVAAISVSSFTLLSSAYTASAAEMNENSAIPTLTELNADDPAAYPNKSAYQLKQVAEGEIPQLFNITKYLYSADIYTPVQYNVVFEDALGDEKPTGEGYSYFKWEEVIDPHTNKATGHLKLVGTTNSSEADIKAYSSDNRRFENDGSTTKVEHSFLGLERSNSGEGTRDAFGGAFYNVPSGESPQNLSITGDFIGNSASPLSSVSVYADGNGISNPLFPAEPMPIDANAAANANARGGAIYNTSDINSVIGNFIGNSAFANATAKATASSTVGAMASATNSTNAQGGAILNTGRITSITGDFIGNSAFANATANAETTSGSITLSVSAAVTSYAQGGAILNTGTVTSITGDFTGNSASANGSAIMKSNDEISNMGTTDLTAQGGAIYNKKEIENITGDFSGNSSYATGNVTGGDQQNLSASVQGGAIYNTDGSINNITGDFISNSAMAVYAINSSFGFNSVDASAQGGAIYNIDGSIKNITGDFISNSAMVTHAIDPASGFVPSMLSAQGGAIYNTTGSIGFLALDSSIQFSGNFVSSDGGTTKTYEAIYNENGTLQFNSFDANSIVVNDGIGGDSGRNNNIININNGRDGADAEIAAGKKLFSTVAFNSFVDNQSIVVHAGELHLGKFSGVGAEGDTGYVPSTQANLNNSTLSINSKATATAFNASALGNNNTITNSGTLSIAEGTLNNDITQLGGTLSTAGALSLGSDRKIINQGQGNVIKGTSATSTLSGGSIVLEDSSSLSMQNITLTKIAITTAANATISLENITLTYDDVVSGSITRLTRETAPLNYTLQGIDVGAAIVSGSMTLDVNMIESELAVFNTAVAAGADIFFNVEGLADAHLVDGLIVNFDIDGDIYQAANMGVAGSGVQFSIIPEPSTASLSLLALAGLLARRRRKEA